jgi:hypothetical protein
MLRLTEQRAAAILVSLHAAGLLDKDDKSVFSPHNWDKRQFKSDVSTERVRRFRNNQETFRKRPHNTESETERKKDAPTVVVAPVQEQLLTLPSQPPDTLEAEYFRRARAVFGKAKGGSLAKQLLICKGGDIRAARAALEQAAMKGDPETYARGIIHASNQPKTAGHPAGPFM